MKSKQEIYVQQLSCSITGYFSVFHPIEYDVSNGKSKREPADLAWHFHDTVILMYMQEMKTPREELITSRKEKIIKHNLSQAEGWLKAWKNGKNLIGKNKFQNFDIPYSQELSIIILSIYEIGALDTEIHDDFMKKNNVSICASLPTNAIVAMKRITASPVDIVAILRSINKNKSNDTKLNCIQIIYQYHLEQISEYKKNKLHVDQKLFEFWLSNLFAYRLTSEQQVSKVSKKTSDLGYEMQFMNDLTISDFLTLANAIAHCFEKYSQDKTHQIYATIKLTNIEVMLMFFDLGQKASITKFADLAFDSATQRKVNTVLFLFSNIIDKVDHWSTAVKINFPTNVFRQSQILLGNYVN